MRLGDDYSGDDSFDTTDPSSAFYDPSQAGGGTAYPTAADLGNTGADYASTTTGVGTTAPTGGSDFWSMLSSGVSGLTNLFSPGGGSSAPPPSGAPAPGAPGYNGSVTATTGPGGTSITANAQPTSPLSSLTDFSTPLPWLAIGGVLLVVLMSKGK